MADRLDLQRKLENILGSEFVYYNPPDSKKMQYTAVRYSLKDMGKRHADDRLYSLLTCYELVVISQRPDDPVVRQILALPYCSYDRHYRADNLYHDVLTLYY